MLASTCLYSLYAWLILAMVFGVKLSDEDIADFEVLGNVVMATNFGTKIAVAGFV